MPRGTRRRERPQHRSRAIAQRKQLEIERYELKLSTHQRSCFKGAAVVQLADLCAGRHTNRLIDDRQNVVRLRRTLRTQGCYRLRKEFHVPVAIDVSDWQAGHVWFQDSVLGPDRSLRQLCKSPTYTLLALDQESLIEAARARFQELGEDNPWWIADVYVTDAGQSGLLDEELIRTLRENFHQERFPSDGHIYQSLRFYQGATGERRNKTAENFWWAVLRSKPGNRKADYLRALPPSLAEAFDALLPIKGLWADMSIGVLHKLRALRCSEPIICYLKHIQDTFNDMVGGRAELLSQIDATTVHLLQSRAPGVSAQDLRFLSQKRRLLFKHIECEHERNDVLLRMEQIRVPIPTLKTFFQDILFLNVGQSVMRKLCRNPWTGTRSIDQILEEQYILDSGRLVPDSSLFRAALYDLWRFSLQFAFDMTTQKDHHRRVPRKREDMERAHRHHLAETPVPGMARALELQFFELARRHGIRPPESADHSLLTPSRIPSVEPIDFPPEQDEDVELERRCGKPFTDCIGPDRYALSLESLSNPPTATRVGAVLVRQSVFHAFFGYLRPQVPDRLGGSRSDSDDTGVTSGWESFEVASEPGGITHPSPVRPGRTPIDLERSSSTPDPDLVAPSYPPVNWNPGGTTHFRFEVVIFQTMQTLWLPNSRDALEYFFLMLYENEFHFYVCPEEGEEQLGHEGRTIAYFSCYSQYLNFPYATLRGVYCQGCPRHPVSLPGRANSREEMAHGVRSLVQAGIDVIQMAAVDHPPTNGFTTI